METPTRLRREVEALTSNMQALSTLTPNTLHARARARFVLNDFILVISASLTSVGVSHDGLYIYT